MLGWAAQLTETYGKNDEYVKCLESAAYNIEQIPAADMRPVVRAAWQSWEQDKPPCKWYSCDYCGFHALSKSNYCPNCGADMKEES